MLIKLNNEGQVVDIQESTLVANSTYGDSAITVTFDESVSDNTLLKFKSCTLSVIRNDSVVIDGLYMEKVISERLYRFNYMTDSGILDVAGNLQLSVQITTDDGSVFASVTLAAFVQNNIGKLSKDEADDVETRIKALYISPMSDTLAKKLDMLSEADSTRDKAYILLSTNRSEGSDEYLLKQPFAFIIRDGSKYAYGILGATKDGDYLIPNAEKSGNPVNLGQLTTILADYIKTAEKGVANGVAPLNASKIIDYEYLPSAIKDFVINIDKKVDKLSPDTLHDIVYCVPNNNSEKQDLWRVLNESGEQYPHSILTADGNGQFHIPLFLGNESDNSPVPKQALSKYVKNSEIGKSVASLDSNGKVPAAQLPSYVDDVLDCYVRSEATQFSVNWLSLESGGAALSPESGKIYVVLNGGFENRQFRWSGTRYSEISSSLALGEVSGTAYDGAKGKELATKIDTVSEDVEKNTSDIEALSKDVEIGDFYVGEKEPTASPIDGWVDTSESEISNSTIIKSADSDLIISETIESGEKIITFKLNKVFKYYHFFTFATSAGQFFYAETISSQATQYTLDSLKTLLASASPIKAWGELKKVTSSSVTFEFPQFITVASSKLTLKTIAWFSDVKEIVNNDIDVADKFTIFNDTVTAI